MKGASIMLAASALLAAQAAQAGEPAALPPARLVGTVLNAVAIERELAFYENAFGLKVGMTLDHGTRREYMLRFSADPGEAGLIIVHDTAPEAPARLAHGNAFDRIVLRVSDMDALVRRLDASGTAHQPVRAAAQGYRVLLLQDPEGYPLEVIQSSAAAREPGQ
ncbi:MULTISPECIES: VOC family protein [Novosphingobium]|uniref:VOC family protein n=1 Tax=Novosphingobium sp. TaxID=1874826 RepID=UPI0012C252B1|nr:VOC family protein [Novosphingobium sp.]MPS69777.1 VOC family protein [Novosphingobium sp.]